MDDKQLNQNQTPSTQPYTPAPVDSNTPEFATEPQPYMAAPTPNMPENNQQTTNSPVPAPNSVPYTPASAPVQTSGDKNDKLKVQLIGMILFVVSVISILSTIYLNVTGDSDDSYVNIVVGIVTALIGFGLTKYNKVAYTAFNVLAILSILVAVFIVPAQFFIVSYAFVIFGLYPLETIIMLLGALALLLQLALFIVGGILLHKKSIQMLFKRSATR